MFIFISPDINEANARNVRLNSLYDNGDIIISSTCDNKNRETIKVPFYNKKYSNFLVRALFEILFGVIVGFRSIFINNKIFVLSSPPFFSCFTIAIFLILFRKNYIVDIRDHYPDVLIDLGVIKKNSALSKIFLIFEKVLYSKALYITCVTESFKKVIENRYRNKKVFIVSNGYSKYFHENDEKHSEFTVIFHGNMGKLYDLELMIKLAKSLQDDYINFHFVGKGEKRHLLDECNLRNVKTFDPVPEEEVANMVSKCHLGIVFLIKNKMVEKLFPVKVYEYIGSEIPFISYPIQECSSLSVVPPIEDEDIFLEECRKEILRLKNLESFNYNFETSIYSREKQKNKFRNLVKMEF